MAQLLVVIFVLLAIVSSSTVTSHTERRTKQQSDEAHLANAKEVTSLILRLQSLLASQQDEESDISSVLDNQEVMDPQSLSVAVTCFGLGVAAGSVGLGVAIGTE